MPVVSSEHFFDVVQKNGLFTKDDLREARDSTTELDETADIARRLVTQGFLSRWQASQLIADKFPVHFGKYNLLDLLSLRDVGKVYLAEHEQMERRVVIKTVSRKTGGAEALQQFLAESRSLATLDHRNLIHVYDVDKQDDTYYLVMEYVQGEDLQEIVARSGPLPFNAAAGYIALAAGGLAHAHEQGIQHHRIEPDRLLIDTKGQLKVIDIGMARLVDPDEASKRPAAAGSSDHIDYLAPEQATGKNKIDYRADIYALGCCLYYVLTGHPPYPDGDPKQRLQARLRKQPPSVLDERPDTPEEIAKICAEMIATQPRQRMASCDEAAKRLNRWLKDYQAARRPPPAAPRAKASSDDSSSDRLVATGDSEVEVSAFAIDVADDARPPGAAGAVNAGEEARRPAPVAAAQAAAVPAAVSAADESSDAVAVPLKEKKPINPLLYVYGGLGLVALLTLGTLLYVLFGPEESVGEDRTVAATTGDSSGGTTAGPDTGGTDSAQGVATNDENANGAGGDAGGDAGGGADGDDSSKDGDDDDGIGEPGGAQKAGPGDPGPAGGDGGQAAGGGQPGKLDSSTLAYWRFEEGLPGGYVTRTPVSDQSGHGNNLYSMAPSVAPRFSDVVASETPKLDDKATVENLRSLDDTMKPGGQDVARYLMTDSTRSKPKTDLAAFSLETWTIETSFCLDPDHVSGQQTLLSKDGKATLKAPALALRANGETGKIELAIIDSGGQTHTLASDETQTLQAEKWYHVAVVSDGQQLKLFVGVDDGKGCHPAGSIPLKGVVLAEPGAWSVGCGLVGGKPSADGLARVDEVRITAEMLDPADFLFPPQAEQVATAEPKEPDGGGDKPDGTGAEKPPAKQPAKPSSLEGLQAIAELPELKGGEGEAGATVALGSVSLNPSDEFSVSLAGADTGHGGRGSFVLQQSGDKATRWDVRHRPPETAKGDEQVVAQIALEGDELTFAWQPAAAESQDANFLRNCVLKCAAGDASQTISLRPHVESEGMTFGFGKASRRGGSFRASLEWLPDPESMHVEFRVDPVAFDPHKFDPQNSLSGDRGETVLVLGEKGSLRVKFVATWKSSGVQIAMRPYYRLPDTESDQPFSLERVQRAYAPMAKKVDTVRRGLDELIKLEGRKKPNNKEKVRLVQIRTFFKGAKPEQIQPRLDQMTAALEQFNVVLSLAENYAGDEVAPIELRIYRLVDDTQIDLLQTIGWATFQPDGGDAEQKEAE